MTYDLREEKWIPFRRRSGVVECGPPWLLTDRLDDDPIVSIAAPRPDFEGTLLEFLIGLLTVAIYPADEEEWRRLWDAPPSPQCVCLCTFLKPLTCWVTDRGFCRTNQRT